MFDLIPFHGKRGNDLFGHMLESFNDVFDRYSLSPLSGSTNSFNADIQDKGDKYVVEAELPGFSKEDIEVDYNSNYLRIRAVRNQTEETKDDADQIIRRERRYGEFVRQFYVDNIDENGIQAKLDNGILELTLPKKATDVPPHKRIEIQ